MIGIALLHYDWLLLSLQSTCLQGIPWVSICYGNYVQSCIAMFHANSSWSLIPLAKQPVVQCDIGVLGDIALSVECQ